MTPYARNHPDTRQYGIERARALMDEPQAVPLSLAKLRMSFVLLASGLLLATATFVGELLIFRFKSPTAKTVPGTRLI